MESVKQTINSASTAVSETFGENTAAAKKEGDKSTAQDSSKGLGERASAGVSALGNKADETTAAGKKENAKNNI